AGLLLGGGARGSSPAARYPYSFSRQPGFHQATGRCLVRLAAGAGDGSGTGGIGGLGGGGVGVGSTAATTGAANSQGVSVDGRCRQSYIPPVPGRKPGIRPVGRLG